MLFILTLQLGSTSDFILSFIAIVPLASLLGEATEQTAVKLGQTLGGLLNATFGNLIEIVVGLTALRKGELRIVQTSMLGSILSNVLLVLGCSVCSIDLVSIYFVVLEVYADTELVP